MMLRSVIQNWLGGDTNTWTIDQLTERARMVVSSVRDNHLLEKAEGKDLNLWLRKVQSYLQTTKSEQRWLGAILLRATVQQCPSVIMEANCRGWTGLAASIIGHPKEDHRVKILCADILEITLPIASTHSELKRQVSVEHVPTILKAVLNILSAKTTDASLIISVCNLGCMCISTFPGPTKQILGRLREASNRLLDSMNTDIAHAAAKLGACIYRCAQQKKLGETWSEQLLSVVGSMHETLSQVLEGTDEGRDWLQLCSSMPTLRLGPVPEEQNKRFTILLARFSSLSILLQNLLIHNCPVARFIPLNNILGVVYRCQDISTESWRQPEASPMAAFVPRIHAAALDILCTLCKTLGRHMSLHAVEIASYLMEMLGRKNCTGCARVRVYEAILETMFAMGAILNNNQIKILIDRAIEDYHSETRVITKKDVRFANISGVGGDMNTWKPIFDCVNGVLLVHGEHMTTDIRTKINKFVVTELSQKLLTPGESCARMELELFSLLKTVILTQNIAMATVMPYALYLFQRGLFHTSIAVRSLCREGIKICNQITRQNFSRGPRSTDGSTQMFNNKMEVEKRNGDEPSLKRTRQDQEGNMAEAKIQKKDHSDDLHEGLNHPVDTQVFTHVVNTPNDASLEHSKTSEHSMAFKASTSNSLGLNSEKIGLETEKPNNSLGSRNGSSEIEKEEVHKIGNKKSKSPTLEQQTNTEPPQQARIEKEEAHKIANKKTDIGAPTEEQQTNSEPPQHARVNEQPHVGLGDDAVEELEVDIPELVDEGPDSDDAIS
eukprot:m.127548 g.127548  ORF g.127548 m.127548 type:complete len:781 (+) comp14549_c0_seq2:207-2549(+)